MKEIQKKKKTKKNDGSSCCEQIVMTIFISISIILTLLVFLSSPLPITVQVMSR